MPKLIDNDNDDAAVPETAYQGGVKAVSGKGTSLSAWGLTAAVLLIAAVGVFALTRSGAHTDPAPNGGSASNGAAQPAPAQNSP
jgi:hypothetical protein